jgi:hypothetical protein
VPMLQVKQRVDSVGGMGIGGRRVWGIISRGPKSRYRRRWDVRWVVVVDDVGVRLLLELELPRQLWRNAALPQPSWTHSRSWHRQEPDELGYGTTSLWEGCSGRQMSPPQHITNSKRDGFNRSYKLTLGLLFCSFFPTLTSSNSIAETSATTPR